MYRYLTVKNSILLFFALVISQTSFAQELNKRVTLTNLQAELSIHKADSISQKLEFKKDSAYQASMQKMDSIRNNFQSNADSIQVVAKNQITQLSLSTQKLQSKIDSLCQLKLPTVKITAKLDSINQLKANEIAKAEQKLIQLKAKTDDQLKTLGLPKEMDDQVKQLSQSLNNLKMPTLDGKKAEIDFSLAKLPSTQLPNGINSPSISQVELPANNDISEISKLSGEAKAIATVTNQIGDYGKDLKQISKGNFAEVKNLDKKVEQELMKQPGMNNVNATKTELDKYRKQLSENPDSITKAKAKEMVKEQITQQATDHFAGKESVLKEAMVKMNTLKNKYSELSSMGDMPKRKTNEMQGKPFIERMTPGITWQLMQSSYTLVDINLSVAYRLTGKLNIGLGWNDRLAIQDWSVDRKENVFGPRFFAEYKLKKGFSLRGDVELFNALMPKTLLMNLQDLSKREWEVSVLAGMKKEFKISKTVRGNLQVMYRLWSDHDRVPFPDRLNTRIGLDVLINKKPKK